MKLDNYTDAEKEAFKAGFSNGYVLGVKNCMKKVYRMFGNREMPPELEEGYDIQLDAEVRQRLAEDTF